MLHVINLEALETCSSTYNTWHVVVRQRKFTGYDGVVRRSLGRLVGGLRGGVGGRRGFWFWTSA